ncbi:MAG: hypothetical protein IPI79_08835 [Moraxellaceae bacterium]|nr:hypothetical protein [Moraxellaceae bacterium]
MLHTAKHYTELQKQGDALELVLGCAVVHDEQQSYQHPLIIKPVQLSFIALTINYLLETARHQVSFMQSFTCIKH